MRRFHTSKLGWILATATAILVAGIAAAADLDAAKRAGQIGEGADGFVHLVDNGAPADVKALVQEVNSKRKEKYEEIADKRSIPLDAVAAQAGAKLLERAESGEYVMDASGSWKKRK